MRRFIALTLTEEFLFKISIITRLSFWQNMREHRFVRIEQIIFSYLAGRHFHSSSDLPEPFLSPKISSKIGVVCYFHAYQELEKLLRATETP